jgi:hypothetical protein
MSFAACPTAPAPGLFQRALDDRQNRQVLLSGRLSFHLDQSSEAKHVNADAWGEVQVHGIVQRVVLAMTAPDLTQQIERPVAGRQQLAATGFQTGFRRRESSLRLRAVVGLQFPE